MEREEYLATREELKKLQNEIIGLGFEDIFGRQLICKNVINVLMNVVVMEDPDGLRYTVYKADIYPKYKVKKIKHSWIKEEFDLEECKRIGAPTLIEGRVVQGMFF